MDTTFEALIVDWDGTAVPDRAADASVMRDRIEALCAAGVHVFITSGTHLENVDEQLGARPRGRGRLFLCVNRGSEVFELGAAGARLVWRRVATDEENRALDAAAARTAEVLAAKGLSVEVVGSRLNRRKIDLIPEPEWADPRKADIGQLAVAVKERIGAAGIESLSEIVGVARDAARDVGLAGPRITSDVKHVEIGLTDKADSAAFAATWLQARGITGSLILIAGDELGPVGGVPGSDSLMMTAELRRAVVVSVGVEPGGVPNGVVHLGGGPRRFAELLDAQLARRRDRRVPGVDLDAAWVVWLPNGRVNDRVAESLGTLSNGLAGVRAAREEDEPSRAAVLMVNGVYGERDCLLPGPQWIGLEPPGVQRSRTERRVLDLRTGTLARFGNSARDLTSLRFVSTTEPHMFAQRAEASRQRLTNGAPLRPPLENVDFAREGVDHVRRACTRSDGHEIAVAVAEHVGDAGDRRTVEKLVGWAHGAGGDPAMEEATATVARLKAIGFDALLAAHREEWAQRWSRASVDIEGDAESELAARFAVFHLLSATGEAPESAVGARGLTGDAYGGHVFWDADVFVLPAVVALHPQGARAMLEYRIRRLPAARAEATRRGLQGARFPWESASDGSDVTPRMARGPHGERIPIVTGQHEEHIVADVAWAATRYATWTGDKRFLRESGRDLVLDSARYWASRIRLGPDGRGHIYGVVGPDEYHSAVDDNAYTNVMARWNLRSAANLLDRDAETEETRQWRDLAELLVDGWDKRRGIYEQFAGYFDLDPLTMADVAQPPVPADILLGPDRVTRSQIIKQADVLMLHHLVPDEVEPCSLERCLDFYEPRTAHGSSLSPAISACLLAQAGQPERALALLRLALRLDLDDITSTTAGGLHMATLGGVWQALAHGFLGLRVEGEELAINPCLPAEWKALCMRLWFHGVALEVRAEHARIFVRCTSPVRLRLPGRPGATVEPPGTDAEYRSS